MSFSHLLAQFYEVCEDAIIFIDSKGFIQYLNPASLLFFGYDEKSLLGQSIELLIPEAHRQDFSVRSIRRRFKVDVCHKNGDLLAVDIGLCTLSYQNETWVAISLRDARDDRLVHDKLYFLAHHDRLTGLMNVDAFFDALYQHMTLEKPDFAAVFLIDIDNFKSINDTFGHAVGDQFLVAFGERLKRFLGPKDVISRIGGDEFACMTKRFSDASEVYTMANQLLSNLVWPCAINHVEVCLTASIGISLFPSDSKEARALLAQADEAMYYVKKRGKNNISFYQARSLQPSEG